MIISYQKRSIETAIAVFANLGLFVCLLLVFDVWEETKASGLVVLFLFVISLYCASEGWSASSKNEKLSEGGAPVDIFLCQITGIILLLIFSVSLCNNPLSGSNFPYRFNEIGAGLAFVGIFLRFLAFRQLSAAFVSLPQVAANQELITTGIYKFIRHPSEAGLFCIASGVSIMMGSIMGLVMFGLLMLPTSYIRVRREEQILINNFGDLYLNYINGVPSLFPYPVSLEDWKLNLRR